MKTTFESTHEGRVFVYHISGVLTKAGIEAYFAERYLRGVPAECAIYIIDLTEAGFQETGKEEVVWLASTGLAYRLRHDDTRPTILVAPDAVSFGLSNMLVGFNAGHMPLSIARSYREAVAQAEERLASGGEV